MQREEQRGAEDQTLEYSPTREQEKEKESRRNREMARENEESQFM